MFWSRNPLSVLFQVSPVSLLASIRRNLPVAWLTPKHRGQTVGFGDFVGRLGFDELSWTLTATDVISGTLQVSG